MQEVQQQAVLQALKRNEGHKAKAAAELQVSTKTVYNHFDRLVALGLWVEG